MRTKMPFVLAVPVLCLTVAIGLSACVSSEASPTVTVTATETVQVPPSAAPTSPSSSPAPAPSSTPQPQLPDAVTIAEALADEVDTAYGVEKVTVKNDPNDLIGRPGGYTSAAYIYDENVESIDSELNIDNGAKIESFKNERDPRTRYKYLKDAIRDNPILTGEYTYIEEPVLLRVAQDVPPKVARKYRELFRELLGPYV